MAQRETGLPFDDIRRLIREMPEADQASYDAARARDATLTKPPGSLGRLEEIAAFMASWQRKRPAVMRPLVTVFAGNHGVVAHGVSAYPQSVTRQMLDNFGAGGAAINQICNAFNIGFKAYDLALEFPTGDITVEPAMDEKTCVGTMAFGMEAIGGGHDLVAIGEMGIGNTTIAAAIYAALYGGDISHWVGRGTGVDDAGLKRKIAAVETALAAHKTRLGDPLEILRHLGGREVAAMAGVIIAARMERIPVILDGYVATAAAAVLHAVSPHTLDHCLAGHLSAEGAHRDVLKRIGKEPILDLGMRLGEGSGAALAIAVVKAAVACHDGMATFGEAHVDSRA
jgi:nicotinate-nucleotide--dimethylbenzimidazole phosphoribosyltransferase